MVCVLEAFSTVVFAVATFAFYQLPFTFLSHFHLVGNLRGHVFCVDGLRFRWLEDGSLRVERRFKDGSLRVRVHDALCGLEC